MLEWTKEEEMKPDYIVETALEMVEECKRQHDMWGDDFDKKNNPNDWAAYITRYVADGAYDGTHGRYTDEKFITNLKKAGAMCISAINAYQKNGGFPPRHYEEGKEED